ncbi:MAG: hypothetical protein ACM34I_08625 [bacterium]
MAGKGHPAERAGSERNVSTAGLINQAGHDMALFIFAGGMYP